MAYNMILLTLYSKMLVKKCIHVKMNAKIVVKNIKCPVFERFHDVGNSSSKTEGMLLEIE